MTLLPLPRPCPTPPGGPNTFLRECRYRSDNSLCDHPSLNPTFCVLFAARCEPVDLDLPENPCSTETGTTFPRSESPRSQPTPTRTTSGTCLGGTGGSRGPTSSGIETRARARDSRLSVSRAGRMEKRRSRRWMDEVSRGGVPRDAFCGVVWLIQFGFRLDLDRIRQPHPVRQLVVAPRTPCAVEDRGFQDVLTGCGTLDRIPGCRSHASRDRRVGFTCNSI